MKNFFKKPKSNMRTQNPVTCDEGIYIAPQVPSQIGGKGRLDRLYYHRTLNSIRKSVQFKEICPAARDNLDFMLLARYDHGAELFPNKLDVVMQPETVGEGTVRRLRNRMDVVAKKEEHMGHPVRIGGTTQKNSPHSVKLMNSGHHTQLTNPGYSRQPNDGNIFKY